MKKPMGSIDDGHPGGTAMTCENQVRVYVSGGGKPLFLFTVLRHIRDHRRQAIPPRLITYFIRC
jgi:hypothetical protein